jgi:uncharacterized membrane protein
LKTKLESGLLTVNILSLLLIFIIALFPSDVLRIILGIPFIVFFPGYTLVAALFPRKADIGGIERLALSFGLSIALTPLIGLILNYTPWGIRLYPILVALTVFVVGTSAIAWYRRRNLLDSERFSVTLNINLSQWRSRGRLDRILVVFLVASILGAIGTLTYIVVNPRVAEKFTEFYILGPGGNATNYPNKLTIGEEGRVILGIVNHEHENNLSYRVEIMIDGEINSKIGPLSLDNGDRWESEVGFIPREAGNNEKVEFILYKNNEEQPYRSLYLWIDVNNTN